MISSSTTRLQLKGDDEKQQGIIETIKNIYLKEGGLKGLYAGLESDTLATVLSSFIYFYCYTALRNVQEKMNTNMGKSSAQLNVAQELFLGAEAALISRFFTTPVSNVTTRLQTAGQNEKGFKQTALDILKEKGVTGFWTGKYLNYSFGIWEKKLINTIRLSCFHCIGVKSIDYLFCF